MKKLVIMPGGFHPYHAGHLALYQSAKKAFPDAEVYVAATNDQSERPFPFALKEKLAKLAGVEPGHFIQVKSPFQAKEITQNYDPEQDVLIFVRSEKDRTEQPQPGGTKKDGSPAYFQPWTGKDLQPFSKHAYMAYLPTVEFGPGITSATQIRKAWPTLNDKRKTAMVMSLYPATQKNPKLAKNVVGMFDEVMGGQVDEGAEEALQYATQAHAGQTRSGGEPYITHPMRVADHIKQYKQSHNLDALISAAYLHDTIEDTDTTHEALHDLFGGLVASLVKELTSDPEQIKKVGKAQYLAHKMAAMSSYALVIKLADRLDNVKDITTARTPQWRQKYKNETEHILNYIEKTRALSGTHQKLIELIRAKLSELNNPQPEVNEVLNTKPNKINKSTWSDQTEDLVKLNFVASNGIPYDLSITALYMSPDEIQDSVPEEIPDEIIERGRFVEFIQEVKPGAGYGKQGIEGTGAAAEILAIVYNGLSQYIKKHKPTFLMFQAAEPSRRRLYSTLVKKMLQTMPNWKYTENDGIFFVYDTRYIKQGMEEGFGIPMPGTYEQEHDMNQKQSGHHTRNLTTETNMSKSADYLEEK
jgi:hypothetical protein